MTRLASNDNGPDSPIVQSLKLPQPPLKQLGIGFGLLLLSLPVILYGWRVSQRPTRQNVQQLLFQGVTYTRLIRNEPRPMVIHQVELDLRSPGITAQVSPGIDSPINGEQLNDQTAHFESRSATTTDFLEQSGLQVAINANFFYPFREITPWWYYPKPNDAVNLLGTAIADGQTYSPPERSWPAFCVRANQVMEIVQQTCPADTKQAVAGDEIFVMAGQPVDIATKKTKAYARTAIALDQQRAKLWLIVVDGKQPGYSEGATMAELAAIAVDLGVDNALNLDGGGSATLAIATDQGPKVLNAPIHTKIPLRERPVANQLGFSALLLTP
ncbi:MAG: phosphodiester glycosidase family protein [Cyanobacteria bacterium P01_H01_bin.121]